MEEEKKIEETSKEVEQLGITTKEDDSKKPFLEQRPYHNKYKSDVDIEVRTPKELTRFKRLLQKKKNALLMLKIKFLRRDTMT